MPPADEAAIPLKARHRALKDRAWIGVVGAQRPVVGQVLGEFGRAVGHHEVAAGKPGLACVLADRRMHCHAENAVLQFWLVDDVGLARAVDPAVHKIGRRFLGHHVEAIHPHLTGKGFLAGIYSRNEKLRRIGQREGVINGVDVDADGHSVLRFVHLLEPDGGDNGNLAVAHGQRERAVRIQPDRLGRLAETAPLGPILVLFVRLALRLHAGIRKWGQCCHDRLGRRRAGAALDRYAIAAQQFVRTNQMHASSDNKADPVGTRLNAGEFETARIDAIDRDGV